MEASTGASTAITTQPSEEDQAGTAQMQAMSPFAITRLLNPDQQRGKIASSRPSYASRLEPEIEYYGPSYRSSAGSTPERSAHGPVETAHAPVEIPVQPDAAGVASYGKVDNNDIRHDQQVESEFPRESVATPAPANGKRGTRRANEKQLVPGRRAEQNRKAQTAFRDRQAMRMRDLESQVETLGAQVASAKHAHVENYELRKYIDSLQAALQQANVPCPEPPASLDCGWRLKIDLDAESGGEVAARNAGGAEGR